MSLERLVGTWDFAMRHVALAEPVTGQQTYERVLDGRFLQLRWTYRHPEFPDALVLLDGTTYHYFDVRGVVRVFAMQVDDEGWSITRTGDDFWQRSQVRFTGPGTMVGTGENSYDGGSTWQHDFDISCERVGPTA